VTKGLIKQPGCITQHVELAKLRPVQIVGDLDGGEGMLFHEETVSPSSPIRSTAPKDDVDQHSRQTRQGPGGQ
jgi:hypothetical protein